VSLNFKLFDNPVNLLTKIHIKIITKKLKKEYGDKKRIIVLTVKVSTIGKPEDVRFYILICMVDIR